MPWLGVLVCGDYLSPVEIPWISDGGSLEAYVATLARLRPLVQSVENVVPGHGGPIERDRGARDPRRGPSLPSRRCAQTAPELNCRMGAGRRPSGKIHDQNVTQLTS